MELYHYFFYLPGQRLLGSKKTCLVYQKGHKFFKGDSAKSLLVVQEVIHVLDDQLEYRHTNLILKEEK